MLLLIPMVDTQASSIAGIIAAVGTLITALGAIWLASRQQQMNQRVKETDAKVEEAGKTLKVVDTIVNQKFTDQQRYIIALREQVIRLGGDPVVDQSQPVTGQPDAQPGQPLVGPSPPAPLGSPTPAAAPAEHPPLVMKEVREGDDA